MAPSARTLARRARRQIPRPWRFLARAAHANGPEREAVVQAAKAAAAAGAAWMLARWVLHAPQPFLAPYAAVFLVVQVTVYRSVRDAGQQLAVVAAGVVLALLATLMTAEVVVGRARDSVAWARESLRLNPIRRRIRAPEPTATLAPAADAVVEVAGHVRDLCEATVEAAEQYATETADSGVERNEGDGTGDEEAGLDPLFVGSFADLLDHLADALEEIRDDPGALSPRSDRHPPGSAALELMSAVHRDAAPRLPGASGEVRTGWSVEGALLNAAQRAVVDLTGRRPSRLSLDDER